MPFINFLDWLFPDDGDNWDEPKPLNERTNFRIALSTIAVAAVAIVVYFSPVEVAPAQVSPTERRLTYVNLDYAINKANYHSSFRPKISKLSNLIKDIADDEMELASDLAGVVAVDIALARNETSNCTSYMKVVAAVASAGVRTRHLYELSNKADHIIVGGRWPLLNYLWNYYKAKTKEYNHFLRDWPAPSRPTPKAAEEGEKARKAMQDALEAYEAVDSARSRLNRDWSAWNWDHAKLQRLAEKGRKGVTDDERCKTAFGYTELGSIALRYNATERKQLERVEWLEQAEERLNQVRRGPFSTGFLGAWG